MNTPKPNPPKLFITGASSGIGLTIVKEFSNKGWHVFAGCRSSTDARLLKAINSDLVFPIHIDLTDPLKIKNACKSVEDLVGDTGLQGLVNNAGIAVTGPLEFLNISDIQLQMDTNFIGQVAVTQAFLPAVRKGNGRIVNMSSISGKVAMPFLAPYAASKFALEAFSDSLRAELRPWDIPVIVINPGAVQTPIWDKAVTASKERKQNFPKEAFTLYGTLMERMLNNAEQAGSHGVPSSEVADAVIHALTSRKPKFRYYVGRNVNLAAILLKLTPEKLKNWFIFWTTGFK